MEEYEIIKMFDQISGAHRAMLGLAAIMAMRFTMFTVFTIVPLIKFLEYLVRKVVELKENDIKHKPVENENE